MRFKEIEISHMERSGKGQNECFVLRNGIKWEGNSVKRNKAESLHAIAASEPEEVSLTD
jgi:hypothetical protein